MQHLGDGSFASVWMDTNGNAVKEFHKEEREAALRETTILPLVQERNVIKVVRAAYTCKEQCVVMERAFASVYDMIQADRKDKIAQYGDSVCQYIISSLMQGVSNVHSAGVMHRDIKPENLLICFDGTVNLSDFSLAKFEAEAGCHTPRCGTRAYMAPEVAGCAYTQSADDFSCGITILEVITGALDIERDDIADVCAVVMKYRPEWGALLRGLLQVQPNSRTHCASIVHGQVTRHVVKDDCPSSLDMHSKVTDILDTLNIDEQYAEHLSYVVHRYAGILKLQRADTWLEIIVLTACVVFGHSSDEVDACVELLSARIATTVEALQKASPLSLYICCTQKGRYVPQRTPTQQYCALHGDDNDSDSSSSRSDVSCYSMQSAESETVSFTPEEWLAQVPGHFKDRASADLLQMRAEVAALLC